MRLDARHLQKQLCGHGVHGEEHWGSLGFRVKGLGLNNGSKNDNNKSSTQNRNIHLMSNNSIVVRIILIRVVIIILAIVKILLEEWTGP